MFFKGIFDTAVKSQYKLASFNDSKFTIGMIL
jgi:hypothetical protein